MPTQNNLIYSNNLTGSRPSGSDNDKTYVVQLTSALVDATYAVSVREVAGGYEIILPRVVGTAVAAVQMISAVALPVPFRPVNTVSGAIGVLDNNVALTGVWELNSAGILGFSKADGSNFSGTSGIPHRQKFTVLY